MSHVFLTILALLAIAMLVLLIVGACYLYVDDLGETIEVGRETTYQPKGGMCTTCVHKLRDCSALPFEDMQVVKVYSDGVKAVRCTDHIRLTS